MTNLDASRTARRLRLLARTLLMLFAGLWLFFIIASRWGEGFSAVGLPSLATRGGGIILLSVLAWRWPMLGGSLLLLVSFLLYSGVVPFASGPSMVVRIMLAGPPAIVGALFVSADFVARSRDSSGV